MIDLSGKKALVCGASKGIGYAIAKKMAELNAEVTIMSSNENNLKSAIKKLNNKNKHKYIAVDFNEYKLVEEKVKEKIDAGNYYDILINNSGGPTPGLLLEADIADFTAAFNRHLFASHLISKLLIPKMKENNFGRIINIISISVKEPVENLGVSNTLRGAMNSWSKTLSKEVGKFGITVNNLLPGYTETERLQNLLTKNADKEGKTYYEIAKKIINKIPLGRLGQSEDLANIAAFLASEYASYITGVNIPVDGGFIRGF